MKNKKFVGTVMVPAMLHMFVFIVIPIVIGLVISFFNYNPLSSDNKFIGLGIVSENKLKRDLLLQLSL